MLRSVDGWEAEHFAFGEAEASPGAAPTTVAVVNSADGPTATIPDAHLLFTAQFSRAGTDLVLHGEDGRAVVVQDYFVTDVRARLLSPEGAALSADIVDKLAGPQAPGQYAQAGGTPAAAQPVGRVAQASSDATIVRNGVAVAAQAGDAVLKGDVLQTVSGTIGVSFNDGSTLNLTANTRMVVSDFVYDPRGSQNSQLLDLVQGSLTFISGEVAHSGNMRIGTPVATMGIRGTVGGVTTATDGSVNFYVSQSATGAVILDARGNIVANVVQDGPMIIVRPAGPLQIIAEEVQKTPAQLALELQALQTILNIKAIGDQILQQNQTPDPNANPNPQSTDKPLTQIQIFQDQNKNGTPGNPDNNNGPPNFTTAQITTTTTNPDGTVTKVVEPVVIPPHVNVAPVLDFFKVAVAEGGIQVLSQADFHVTDPDSSSFIFTVSNVTGGTFQVLVPGPAQQSTFGFSALNETDGHWVDVTQFTADDIAAGHVRFVHDGGSAAPNFSISVSDYLSASVSVSGVVEFNHAPEVEAGHATVSEEGLPGGIADSAGTVDVTNSATASGTIAATDADGNQLTFTLGTPSAELFSNGVPVTWSGAGTGTLTGTAGETTVITISIDAHSGAYTVTLSGPVDHPDTNAEDVKSFDVPVDVSDGASTSSTVLTINVEDDSPVAVDYQETARAGVGVTTVNLVLILDVSGSMGSLVSDGETRLSLAQEALHNLLATQNVDINQVMAVAFSGSGNVHTVSSNPWTTAGSADSFIQGLTAGGGTNYDGALSSIYSYWGTGPSPAEKTIVYFISDGEPTSGQGLDVTDTNVWQQFLTDKHVDASYAIGITTSVSNEQLGDIAWKPGDPGFSPILLSSATGLNDTLQGTVPEAIEHNIFTESEAGASFGADGGHIESVSVDGVTYTFDGDHTIHRSDEGASINGNMVTVATALGGTFVFYFAAGSNHAAGDWSYTPPESLSDPTSEVFHYVLVDNDGDHSGADITVAVTAEHYTSSPAIAWTAPGEGENVAFNVTHLHGDTAEVAWGDQQGPNDSGSSFSHFYQDGFDGQLNVFVNEQTVASYHVVVATGENQEQPVVATGTSGNDVLIGDASQNLHIFDGNGGSDVVFASATNDSFVFKDGTGHAVVVGFDVQSDVIDISQFNIPGADPEELQAFLTASAADTQAGLLLTHGADSILLQDVHAITTDNLHGTMPV